MPERHFDVFVATSFSSKVNYDTGEVDPAYREYVEGVLDRVRELGLTAFCAIEYEGWKISQDPAEVSVNTDLDTLDVSDQLLVLLDDSKSDGRSHEQGHASATGKRVSFMLEPGVGRLSYWNQGFVNSGRARLIRDVKQLLEHTRGTD